MPSARPTRSSLVLLSAILVLTAAISLAWSRRKLLNQDEIFVLQTDAVPTAAEVLHIQLHSPISLDPPVYHLLVHAAVQVFGPTPFALRLPSLLGFLLMQVCLFLYVRRAADERAGVLAAALPALTGTLFYSAEARPYGLLLGLFALTLAAYQSATRAGDAPLPGAIQASSRVPALCTLALAIAFALNSHYFAVLLLPPVYAAEFLRTILRRKLDTPVLAAILAGTLSFVFTIPFQHAAAVFRAHYYNAGSFGPRAITQAYRSLLGDYTHTSLHTQHLLALALVLLTLCFLTLLVFRWNTLHLPAAEAAFLLTLAALPFFGYLLARFVTHSIEVRYVLGAIIAIAALAALLAAPLLERRPFLILAALLLSVLISGMGNVQVAARSTADLLASLRIPPELSAALQANPGQPLYIQEVGPFEGAQYYAPDPQVRRRITLVYSSAQEIRIDGHDTEALTAEHLAQFTQLPIISYDELLARPSPRIFLIYQRNGWQWIDQALTEDGFVAAPIAPWFGGNLTLTAPANRPHIGPR